MQNLSKPLQKQCGALVLTPWMMICRTFPWISQTVFLRYPRMSVVPFPAVSQSLLPGIFWAATSLPSVMDNWWAPISHWKFLLLVSMFTTWFDFALSTNKCHFMSITPNQQSHLNSSRVIMWPSSLTDNTSQVFVIPHSSWAHPQTLHTGQRNPSNRSKPGPKRATPPISLPDDFLWIALSIQTTLFACNGSIFSFLPFNSCLEPISSF